VEEELVGLKLGRRLEADDAAAGDADADADADDLAVNAPFSHRLGSFLAPPNPIYGKVNVAAPGCRRPRSATGENAPGRADR